MQKQYILNRLKKKLVLFLLLLLLLGVKVNKQKIIAKESLISTLSCCDL